MTKVDTANSTPRVAASAPAAVERSQFAGQTEKTVPAVQPSDSLRLTGKAMDIKAMARAVASSPPPVDEAKVAALREAIANGSYQIDAHRIANQMLSM